MTGDVTEGSFERLPPQSIEAEQAILGALLISPEVISRCIDSINPEHFYRKAHQVICAAVMDLFEKNEPIDIVTVSQFLKDQGKLDSVGGRQYLTDLALSIATTANAEYYAKTVNEKALLRNLIKAGTEIVSSCYEETDADLCVDKAEQMIFAIAQRRSMQNLTHVKDIVNESFARIEKRYEQRDALSGIPTGFYDLDDMTSGWQKSDLIILAARPSMGKCLTADAEIMLADGTISTIEDIYKAGNARLLTLDAHFALQWTSPTAFLDDGIKPVFEVTTRLGRKITTTLSHPFLTIRGWEPLAAIKPGEQIAIPRHLPSPGVAQARDCEVKLAAFLLGDGSVSSGKVGFTNTNKVIVDDFTQSVTDFGELSVRVDEQPNRAQSLFVSKSLKSVRTTRQTNASILRSSLDRTKATGLDLARYVGRSTGTISNWVNGVTSPSSKEITRINQFLAEKAPPDQEVATLSVGGRWLEQSSAASWLRDIGLLGCTAKTKCVPNFIFRLGAQQISLFLNRLFSTDGWATVYKSGQSQIGYCSMSEKLCRQVQHLLLRIGIIAKLKQKRINYRGEIRIAWQLEITDAASLKNFIDNIGILGKEAAIAKVAAALSGRKVQTNTDLIPLRAWESLRQAKANESWASVARRSGIPSSNIHVGKRQLSRGRLLKLASAVGSQDLVDISQSDVYWDNVVSIKYVGERQVYDLTIPDTHNFVANDICVHNTAFCLNLAQHAAVEGKKPVALFSLEMSKEQLVSRLLCAEARIDANRMRTGFLQSSDWQNLATAMGRLSEAPIFIDDSAVVSHLDVRAKCRRLKSEHKALGLIIIDYIQLMTGRAKSDGNRVQEVSEISRGLKQLARELDCPVIALSQLSRAVEARQNKRPMLSDLRESGCLTGDSMVLLAETGEYERMDALVGKKDFYVYAMNTESWKFERKKVVNAFATGCKPVFKMTTRSKRQIKATANHKFLTVDGWRRLDELSTGMYLATPRVEPGISEAESSMIELEQDIIPKRTWFKLVEPAMAAAGVSTEQLHEALDVPFAESRLYQNNLSRQQASDVAQFVQSESLQKLSTSDVYWDEIVSIKPAGEEEVYDLTVEGLHNFVANNIIVHNSIEQDADIVMFIYRDEYYNQESEKRGEAEIIIAKQRNGPVGTVELLYQASITRFLNKATTNNFAAAEA